MFSDISYFVSFYNNLISPVTTLCLTNGPNTEELFC